MRFWRPAVSCILSGSILFERILSRNQLLPQHVRRMGVADVALHMLAAVGKGVDRAYGMSYK